MAYSSIKQNNIITRWTKLLEIMLVDLIDFRVVDVAGWKGEGGNNGEQVEL